MIKITILCDCEEDGEHEVEVEAEVAYPNRIGLYCPQVGDLLPCGRAIDENDLEIIIEKLHDLTIRED